MVGVGPQSSSSSLLLLGLPWTPPPWESGGLRQRRRHGRGWRREDQGATDPLGSPTPAPQSSPAAELGRRRHGAAMAAAAMDTRRKGPDRRSRRGRRRRSPRVLVLSPCTAAPGLRREGGGARRDGGGQPRARGEARRWREERRAGLRLAGDGRAAWRPVARGRGRRARGVEAGGSQRQESGSPAFYPSRM